MLIPNLLEEFTGRPLSLSILPQLFMLAWKQLSDSRYKRKALIPTDASHTPSGTLEIIKDIFQELPPFQPLAQANKIPIVWLNCELLDEPKAQKYEKVFAAIMSRAGVMAMAEANAAAVSKVAQECGYEFFAAASNSRGQGCVISWHPDAWQLLSFLEHDETSGVDGVADLRASAEVVLYHKSTGYIVRFVASHFKSLRGGWGPSSTVRFDQTCNLLKVINESPLVPTIALGDYNCFLDRLLLHGNKDVDPFLSQSWTLLGDRRNTTPTHLFGGRLDGIFFKWFSQSMQLTDYRVIPIYAAAPEVSDHAAIVGMLSLT